MTPEKEICELIGCDLSLIDAAKMYAQRYGQLDIKKRSGGLRTLRIPTKPLATFQRFVHRALMPRYEIFLHYKGLRGTVHGFRHKHSPRTNAKQHRHNRNFFICDLADAFGHVTEKMVVQIFVEHFGCTKVAAALLAKLTTFKGSIPQGAPSSPMLLNWALANADVAIRRLADPHTRGATRHFVYTRYADDLVIGTNSLSENELEEVGEKVFAIFKKHGFKENGEKTRFTSTRFGSVRITGYTVNDPRVQKRSPKRDAPRQVRLPGNKLRNLRAMLHHAAKGERTQEQVRGSLEEVFVLYTREPKRQNNNPELPSVLIKPYRLYLKAVKAGIVPKTSREQ